MNGSFRNIWARRTKDLCRAAPTVALGIMLVAGCAQQTGKPGDVRAPSQAPPATKSGSGTTMAAGDARAILAYHNKVRTDVGVAPLQWSANLASYAQEWADHLANTTCKMAHRSEHKYGENLFQGTAGHFSAVDAAKAWETEKKDYGGGALTQTNWRPAGHYTQMVWRETTATGCGEALCGSTLIVACNYDPPGNVLGRKPY